MFEGEKTYVFWLGLIILGLSSAILFAIIWGLILALTSGYTAGGYYFGPAILSLVPTIVYSLVFISIGLFMMKSGIKKRPLVSEQTRFCSNCGDEVSINAKFCPNCGKTILSS